MRKIKNLTLLTIAILFVTNINAQRGYFDAPYTRYEADMGTLINATATPASFSQPDLQSEASEQVCVDMTNPGASVEWTLSAEGDGLVVRYSVPDGESGELYVYADNVLVDSIQLTSYYSWEYLWSNGNPNNTGVVNMNPRMRFDEVRVLLDAKIPNGGTLRLERKNGNIHLDFAELEAVPSAITASGNDVVYGGDGSDLQTFIDNNGGDTLYLPPGVYNVDRELYFGSDTTVLKGAGMWYTQIHFTNNNALQGGLRANAHGVSFSGLYLTTVRNSRSDSYKAINGVYTNGATITEVWAEHFEVGAWIAQFNGGSILYADGLLVQHCRFRNNYADGINLSKGTRNSIVEHCSFRNNGDDDMAMWSANGLECRDNTYRYNTSENCWRAAGCAIYGGYNNKAHNLLIKDNLEVGLRVNNSFPGAGFNDVGVHEFYDITILRCGTFNDLFNSPVGAIDLKCDDVAGLRIKNVTFSNIDITDSKNDAIYIRRVDGDGFYNLNFENITIDGTGTEYPDNNINGLGWGRGYGILFVGNPSGFGSYCNMSYANRGGNATVDVNTNQIGSFSWTQAGCGTYITSPLNGETFGECGSVITLTADASAANGAVDSVEFFIDGNKVGGDNTAPYTYDWNGFTLGTHKVYAVSTHAPSATTIMSPMEEITVSYYKGLIQTGVPPVIDGAVDALWSGFTVSSLQKITSGNVTDSLDLYATFRVTYDATNLYLLVDVTDDDLQNDGGNNWENDALEVFIDIGNDKSGGYGPDDYQYNFVYNDATVYETHQNAVAGVTFSQGNKTGGYIMEISIPWATIGTAPTTGELLGFDIHVNDDDGGGGRNAKKAWNDCVDNAWQNPSSFGTLQESGCTSSSAPLGFIDFNGVLVNDNPALDWTTYYNVNDDHFEVQRDVTQTGAFTTIANVVNGGIPGSLTVNAYTDMNAPMGLNAYRIALIQDEGCVIQSNIINLDVLTSLVEGPDNHLNFYPNPFHTSGSLAINTGSSAEYSVTINDSKGVLVYKEIVAGNEIHHIGAELSPGVYVLKVSDGLFSYTRKLIKL